MGVGVGDPDIADPGQVQAVLGLQPEEQLPGADTDLDVERVGGLYVIDGGGPAGRAAGGVRLLQHRHLAGA